ncbi:hypothetical protein MRB53_016527 [Persea americana]|uniref:Uncharacterized protein n=1 Tax=Persea americana TaxID=3435 RepID=A0ACC2M2E7_PERAE|nr:hypothetical protein MRB53_016527 [Persea americana]
MYCQLPSCSSHCANIGRPALWHASHQAALPLPRLKMVAGPQLEPNSQLLQRPASCNVAASCYAQQPVPRVAAGGATTARSPRWPPNQKPFSLLCPLSPIHRRSSSHRSPKPSPLSALMFSNERRREK